MNLKHTINLLTLWVSVIIATACSRDVSITLNRDGEIYIASTMDVLVEPQDNRYAKRTDDLLSHQQWVLDYYKPNASITDLFIIFPLSSSEELWHRHGDKSSSSLYLDPATYSCSQSDIRRSTWTFPRSPDKSDGLYHYDAVIYLPFFLPRMEPSTSLPSPPFFDDICMRIDRSPSNKDPYKNGHTNYSSNELRFTADEINAILETIPQTEN